VERKLKGYVDLNLGAEYRYNKRLGMFLDINNIAATRYFRYVNYPVYRLNVLAGVSYSF
jgi:outer membrane receptor protein involved in Fe transport